MHKITTVTREVRNLCQIISDHIANSTSTGSGNSSAENAVYTIRFEVPGQGYHTTEIAGHQAQEIASGDMPVIDYQV